MMRPMARAVVVALMGVESRFGLAAVNRQKLYGEEKRVVVERADLEAVDAEGRLLSRSESTLDVPQSALD